MSASIVLKFKFGKEIRRVSVEKSQLTWANVVSLMAQLFPGLVGYSLKYEDPEGDKITVSSEQEIREAVSVALSSGGVLRFIVSDKQGKEGKEATRSESPVSIPEQVCSSDQQPVIHAGVVCDGCQVNPIAGVRFKCTVCHDFDLCETCEAAKTHDQSHPLIKHVQPFVFQEHCRRRMGHHGRFPHHKFHHQSHHENNNNMNCDPTSVTPPGFEVHFPPTEFNPKFFCGMKKGRHHLARFVADVTIEDGAVLKAGEKFVKVWKLRNSGESSWAEGSTALHFVGGDQLSAPDRIPLTKVVNPNEEFDISVEMIAPNEAGRYTGYWRLVNSEGRFGQRVWIDIRVENTSVPQSRVVIPAPIMPIPSAPIAVALPTPIQTPPVQVPVVLVVEDKLTETEAKSVEVLKEMGFSGNNLLVVLRKHKGDLVSTIRELCGQ